MFHLYHQNRYTWLIFAATVVFLLLFFPLLGMIIYFFIINIVVFLCASSLTDIVRNHGDKNFRNDNLDLTATLTFTVN